MAKDLNKVQIIGRLGGEPEMRYTNNGTAVTSFRVAASRSYKKTDGQTEEETEWFRVVAWNKLGEICGEYLRKGARVYIEGYLKTRSWEDESGQTRYMTEVVANDMIMLDSRQDQRGGAAADEDDFDAPPARTARSAATPAAPARRSGGSAPARPTTRGPQPATAPARRSGRPVLDDDGADDEDLPF